MTIQTERLTLRAWEESDAKALFALASDPCVGKSAGWNPHLTLDESLEVIRTVFSKPEVYAITLRSSGEIAGCIGLANGADAHTPLADGESEIGYWLGVPYWNKGLMMEAAAALIRHAFNVLGLKGIHGCCFRNNHRSTRVLERCGFIWKKTRGGMKYFYLKAK